MGGSVTPQSPSALTFCVLKAQRGQHSVKANVFIFIFLAASVLKPLPG